MLLINFILYKYFTIVPSYSALKGVMCIISALNRLIQTLKHLQTGTVLMTIAAVGATFVSERLDYRPAKIVVTGTAFLVALSAVNYAIQRYF